MESFSFLPLSSAFRKISTFTLFKQQTKQRECNLSGRESENLTFPVWLDLHVREHFTVLLSPHYGTLGKKWTTNVLGHKVKYGENYSGREVKGNGRPKTISHWKRENFGLCHHPPISTCTNHYITLPFLGIWEVGLLLELRIPPNLISLKEKVDDYDCFRSSVCVALSLFDWIITSVSYYLVGFGYWLDSHKESVSDSDSRLVKFRYLSQNLFGTSNSKVMVKQVFITYSSWSV